MCQAGRKYLQATYLTEDVQKLSKFNIRMGKMSVLAYACHYTIQVLLLQGG